MQNLARDGLTAEQVAGVLRANPMFIDRTGCELVDADLTFMEDISEDILSGITDHVVDADAEHGTIRVALSRSVPWGTVLCRPYMVVSDGEISVRFNGGAYCLTSPEMVLGLDIPVYDVQGYDRLYLLNRSVGDAYSVPAGANVLQAVRDVITASGLSGVHLDGSAQDKTLPDAMVWPLIRAERDVKGRYLPGHDTDYAWLDIVNDLLGVVGYQDLWANEDGVFQSGPDIDAAQRPVEWAFDYTSTDTTVSPDRSLTEDAWQAPNRWVFIQSNRDDSAPPAVEGAGIYIVDNLTDGPSSQARRGLIWTNVQQLDAADQAALVSQGDAIVATDRRVTTTLKVSTAPFPAAGHGDVYTYTDPEVGGTRKVTSLQWTQDLLGADMTHVWAVLP